MQTGYVHRFRDTRPLVDRAREEASALDPEWAADVAGRLSWSDAAAYATRSRGGRRRPTFGWASLTPTELVVAELIAQGRSNPEIAAQLLMAVTTAKTHVSSIMAKLGVRSRAQIAVEAARRAGEGG